MSNYNFNNEVTKELSEMKKIGMRVPEQAFQLAKDADLEADYGNMKVSECADLLIQLCG